MHRAPAVNFSVNRSRWHARLIVCVCLLALAVLAVFVRGQLALDLRTGVSALAIVFASSQALLGWKQSPKGNLRWDGEHWYWSGFSESRVCRLALMMDFQNVVVVRLSDEDQGPVFLWLELNPGDLNWKPLRRAMVSSQAQPRVKSKTTEPSAVGNLA